MSKNPKQMFTDVLSRHATNQLWTVGYRNGISIVPQDFSMGGVLPAVLYMMRWGHRRGKGRFVDTFGKSEARTVREKAATIDKISHELQKDNKSISYKNISQDLAESIIADLLLAYCFENILHGEGRNQPVQRVYPTHYFSSWIDFPPKITDLRHVPEMIVAVLANQKSGEYIVSGDKGHFIVNNGFENNKLLALFGKRVYIYGHPDSLNSDAFDENSKLGIDQLLTVRIAKEFLREAPQKVRGENPNIPNQVPVSTRASNIFERDFNHFIRSYGDSIPRQTLLPMVESCLAIGLTNIYLSSFYSLNEWERKQGILPESKEQRPWPLFVDCSVSLNHSLRKLSEESVDDLLQRIERLPALMCCLNILDYYTQNHMDKKNIPSPYPDPSNRINFLGDIIYGRHSKSGQIELLLNTKCHELAAEFEEQKENDIASVLRNQNLHPVWRLAEALVNSMGYSNQFTKYRGLLDSCLMINEPNGIGRKRVATTGGKRSDQRSIVLTNTSLDFLVHRHLRKHGTSWKVLSLSEFINILKDSYGFYIDDQPPNMSIPETKLKENRAYLERRLRDLGLLKGVNDAESMKRLYPRFEIKDQD